MKRSKLFSLVIISSTLRTISLENIWILLGENTIDVWLLKGDWDEQQVVLASKM